MLYGICTYLGLYFSKKGYYTYDAIKDSIPVFTPQFFNINKYVYGYWWDIHDIQSRMNAFDKLINHYKNLIKEL